MPNSLCQELAERVTAGQVQSIATLVDSYVSSRREIYMPYFVSVGGIPMNASGVGRRGYFVRRSGSKVIVKWGAIGMTRTRPTIFYWAGPNLPQMKTHHFSSIKRANHFATKLKKQKLLQHANHDYHTYTKLPVGRVIRLFSAKLVGA